MGNDVSPVLEIELLSWAVHAIQALIGVGGVFFVVASTTVGPASILRDGMKHLKHPKICS